MEFRDSTGQIVRTKSTPLFTTPQVADPKELFHCSCSGLVKIISDDLVLHSCKKKYAPSETYYNGVENFVPYRRIQVNTKLTNGEVKYNWFIDWGSK